jgi:hypothetical protein
MNKRLHSHKKADSSASNPVRSQFQSRPFIAQAKPQSEKPLTQTESENQEFHQQKFEETKLNLQAKTGTITPEGQERLTVLQAKMSGTLQRRQEQASSNGSNFAKIPISRPDARSQQARADTPTLVQAKLTIGQPGDMYEREADEMASKVMSMSAVAQPEMGTPEQTHSQVRSKPLAAKITPLVQHKAMPQSDRSLQGAGEFESRLRRSKSGGSPLPDKVQAFMGAGYGGDVSHLRAHTGSEAVQMNEQIGALAFTHENHIYYGAGKSPRNDHLTAHEVAHTFQQGGGVVQPEQLQRMEMGATRDLVTSIELEFKARIEKLHNMYRDIQNDNTKFPERLGILEKLDEAINERSNALQNAPESSSNQSGAQQVGIPEAELEGLGRLIAQERVVIETQKKKPEISLASSPKRRFTDFKDYKTIPMLKSFGVTDLVVNEIKYLNESEREEYKVGFVDGKLKYAKGSLIDTKSSSSHGRQGYFIFVMDQKGNIYTAPTDLVQHHSSFLAGQAVASAGEIMVEAGILKVILDESGHYAPTKGKTKQFEDELKKHKVSLTDVEKNYKHMLSRKEIEKKGVKRERIKGLDEFKNDYKQLPSMTNIEEVEEFILKAFRYASVHLDEKRSANKDRLAGWKGAIEKLDWAQLPDDNEETRSKLQQLKQATLNRLEQVKHQTPAQFAR